MRCGCHATSQRPSQTGIPAAGGPGWSPPPGARGRPGAPLGDAPCRVRCEAGPPPRSRAGGGRRHTDGRRGGRRPSRPRGVAGRGPRTELQEGEWAKLFCEGPWASGESTETTLLPSCPKRGPLAGADGPSAGCGADPAELPPTVSPVGRRQVPTCHFAGLCRAVRVVGVSCHFPSDKGRAFALPKRVSVKRNDFPKKSRENRNYFRNCLPDKMCP